MSVGGDVILSGSRLDRDASRHSTLLSSFRAVELERRHRPLFLGAAEAAARPGSNKQSGVTSAAGAMVRERARALSAQLAPVAVYWNTAEPRAGVWALLIANKALSAALSTALSAVDAEFPMSAG